MGRSMRGGALTMCCCAACRSRAIRSCTWACRPSARSALWRCTAARRRARRHRGAARLVGAARGAALKLPVCSDFRTNFHDYSRHYGVGWLQRADRGVPARLPQRTALTMVPTEALRAIASARFRAPRGGRRAASIRAVRPGAAQRRAARSWGAGADDPVALYVGRLAARRTSARCWPRSKRCVGSRGATGLRRRRPGAPSCSARFPHASSPARAAATTSPPTTPRPTCSCSRA